jgi:succinoglycan biosynthesis transport protein ExoP
VGEESQVTLYPSAGTRLAPRAPRQRPEPRRTLELEPTPTLVTYWRVLRKRRWTVVTLVLVVTSVVAVGTLKQRPVYQARALMEIEKENPNVLSLKELFELDTVSDTYLETQYRVLGSDQLARRVIGALDLAGREEFSPQHRPAAAEARGGAARAPAAAVDAEAAATALRRFRERLQITPVKRSRLVEILFESEDPELAARAANTLADEYRQQYLEQRWEATERASEWLAQQLEALKVRLERAEEDLQGYAREQDLLFLATESGDPANLMQERLRDLEEELARATAARIEAESLDQTVAAVGPEALPPADSRVEQELVVRLAELRRERAELETSFTAGYPRLEQVSSQVRELEAELAAARARAAARVASQYRTALGRERLLQRALEDARRQAAAVAERSVQYRILKREVETNRQLYDALLERLKEAGVSSAIRASHIRLVDRAVPPRRPARPVLALNLALGVLLGLGLGVGAAFLTEHLDNSVKSPEDVERYLRLPALAFIPAAASLANGRGRSYGRLPAGRPQPLALGPAGASRDAGWMRIDRPPLEHTALAEAFRSLRTSVLLSAADRPPRTLLVSSAHPGEGKTTVSTNLAIALAQLGQRVLLVDGDMRRPSVDRALGVEESGTGLAAYLAGGADWRSLVRTAPGCAGLDVLPAGPAPPNPAELLSGERMRELVGGASAEYNFVVLDSPPLVNVSDSRILATLVEALLLVVKSGATPREEVRRARALAEDVGANVIGVVLNHLDLRAAAGYGSGYYAYGYAPGAPAGGERRPPEPQLAGAGKPRATGV